MFHQIGSTKVITRASILDRWRRHLDEQVRLAELRGSPEAIKAAQAARDEGREAMRQLGEQ